MTKVWKIQLSSPPNAIRTATTQAWSKMTFIPNSEKWTSISNVSLQAGCFSSTATLLFHPRFKQFVSLKKMIIIWQTCFRLETGLFLGSDSLCFWSYVLTVLVLAVLAILNNPSSLPPPLPVCSQRLLEQVCMSSAGLKWSPYSMLWKLMWPDGRLPWTESNSWSNQSSYIYLDWWGFSMVLRRESLLQAFT